MINARSLSNKIEDLNHIINIYNPALPLINETWLTDINTIKSELSFMRNYQIVLANRVVKRDGGSAILIKNELSFQTMFTGSIFQSEIIHIRPLLKKNIHIINVYRPPNTNALNTKKLLKFISEQIKQNKTIICGDFNIPNILWSHNEIIAQNDKISKIFLEFINQLQLNLLWKT